jgi:O-methyltransferase
MSLKELALKSAWLANPIADLSFRAAYLSKLSSWLREQSCPRDFETREALYDFVVKSEGLDAPVDYIELGVFAGDSMRWFLSRIRHPEAKFVGFDSFEGLPQKWGWREAGAFGTGGKPPADIHDPRCRWEIGWFQNTLPGFLVKNPRVRRTIVHHDEDLYSSTLFTLTQMAAYQRSGDVLLFDDFGSVRSPTHQFRALHDFCDAYGAVLEPLGVTKNGSQAAFKLKSDFPSKA